MNSLKQRMAVAEQAADRYQAVLQGFRGAYANVASRPDPTTAKARMDMQNMVYGLATTFLDGESGIVEAVTDQIALLGAAEALGALGLGNDAPTLPAPLGELLSANREHLRVEIGVQLERDIAALLKRLRHLALGVNVSARAAGISKEAAIIRAKIANRGDFAFGFIDRAGRKWTADRYIRTVWRQHLLNVHIETMMAVYAEHGIDRVEVIYPDPRHNNSGLVFGLRGQDDLPTYAEIADELFHPNSEATLRPIV